MKILIATDAWYPQINGVVRTLMAVEKAAGALGATFVFITPAQFPSVPLPGYPQIPLALPNPRMIARLIGEARADMIHIATEGPVGHLRATLLHRARLALHDKPAHAAARICFGARADPGTLDVDLDAPLPQCRHGRDGVDARPCRRAREPRLP